MISRISGKLFEVKDISVTINVHGIFYEVFVPASVAQRIRETEDAQGNVNLVTYYYFQISPSQGIPVMVGFTNDMEKDFFQLFIKVSGIGPKAAVKALTQPISDISAAIDRGDVGYLKNLPGIGPQRAKEVVAKLQGKVSRFGLLRDKQITTLPSKTTSPDWHQEALGILMQLQYTKIEAERMMQDALKRSEKIESAEDLLNQIYKQKVI